MLVGTVVGQVWATRKEGTLEGLRLLEDARVSGYAPRQLVMAENAERNAAAQDLLTRLEGEIEAQGVRHHVDRLLEAATQHREHGTLRGLFRRLPEEHHFADHERRSVGANVRELLGTHVGNRP